MIFVGQNRRYLTTLIPLVFAAGFVAYNLGLNLSSYWHLRSDGRYIAGLVLLEPLVAGLLEESRLTDALGDPREKLLQHRLDLDRKISVSLLKLENTQQGLALLAQFKNPLTIYLQANRRYIDRNGYSQKSRQFYRSVPRLFWKKVAMKLGVDGEGREFGGMIEDQDVHQLSAKILLTMNSNIEKTSNVEAQKAGFGLATLFLLLVLFWLFNRNNKVDSASNSMPSNSALLINHTVQSKLDRAMDTLRTTEQKLTEVQVEKDQFMGNFEELSAVTAKKDTRLQTLQNAYNELLLEMERTEAESNARVRQLNSAYQNMEELRKAEAHLKESNTQMQSNLDEITTIACKRDRLVKQGMVEKQAILQMLRLRDKQVAKLKIDQEHLVTRLGQLNYRLQSRVRGS